MATALVQMAAFSPCSPLGDMMMMGMDTSLESFPGSREREDGNKRSHSDGDEEQDRSHVKKRRKQSKPIRITATDSASESKRDHREGGQDISELDFSETGEHFLSEKLNHINRSSIPVKEEFVSLGKASDLVPSDLDKASAGDQDERARSEKMFNSLLPLNLSNMKPAFLDSLIIPRVRDSQNTSIKNIPLDNSQGQFQQSQEGSKTPGLQDSSYLSQSSPLLLPLFKQTQIQSQMSQMNSQLRIFNPEAFCDLCNKEFCNKYFLKTHKANKHGIYSENTSGPTLLDPMPSMSFTNYFSTNTESYENQQTFQATNIPKNLFNQTNYPAIRPVQKKSQAPQQPPPQSSLFPLKSTPSPSGNMRALCNICQREFCNKYFVRRHKQKIHGIVDSKDSPAPDSGMQDLSNTSLDKFELPTSEAEMYSGFPKTFNMPSNFSNNFNLDTKEAPQNLETTLEKYKDKSDKEPENDFQSLLMPHIATSVDGTSISLYKISQSEENNKENSLSSNKLKKLGVVNADAFCDICCKEYCNKYFLRTHKLKSHGILPIEEKKEDTVNGTSSNMTWYQYQTTPLNLIVNDSSTNRDAPENNFAETEGGDFICSVCGRFFQSKFLLKMHQAYTHPSKFIASELALSKQTTKPLEIAKSAKDSNEQEKTQPMESYLPIKSEYIPEQDDSDRKTIANTPDNVQKLQTLLSRLNNPIPGESSTCDVCDKDVGSFFLLENHILSEHAILLEEIGSISEEENSSSQSSLAVSTFAFKKECPNCQKIFFKPSQFAQHMSDCHRDLNVSTDPETPKGTSLDLNEMSRLLRMSPTQVSVPLSEERQGLQTPASSFCEICKKELCNKYFMKVHMQRMHGISIENGAQIGGVVCDICKKELCSKYFLRVHKQNSHGIVDELFLPQLALEFGRNQSPNADPALKPNDQNDLSHRYFTHFNEVCPICNRRFRSAKWLKAHLWNDHSEEGKEKWKKCYPTSNSDQKTIQFEESLREMSKPIDFPGLISSSNQSNVLNTNENHQNGKNFTESQGLGDKNVTNNSMFSMLMNGKDSETNYRCTYCSFSTTFLSFLFIHERSHMNNRNIQPLSDQSRQCPICFQTLEPKDSLENHILLHNLQSKTINIDNTNRVSITNQEQSFSKTTGLKLELRNDFNTGATKDKDSQLDKEAINNINMSSQHNLNRNQNQSDQAVDSSVHCIRCGFRAVNIQVYLEHVSREHPYPQMEQELPAYLQQVEQVLSTLASNSGIPAVYAAPRQQPTPHHPVTMQPFVLEDSEHVSDVSNSIDSKPGKTFLSSLVFLPVKEKLKKSVTASFKLTPT